MAAERANVFVIEDEEYVYKTLDEAKCQVAYWQTIIEYKPVRAYRSETVRQYIVSDL